MIGNLAITVPESDSERERLRLLIAKKSVLRDKIYKLASGETSDIYFDLKPTMFDPAGAKLLANMLVEILEKHKVQLIGGLEMGAVPLVSQVCAVSSDQFPISGFFVRKAAKDHGTKYNAEGCLKRGSKVIIVDDVTTSGGSVMQAVNAAREQKCNVELVVTIVDRNEGAVENLRKEGVELLALYTSDEF